MNKDLEPIADKPFISVETPTTSEELGEALFDAYAASGTGEVLVAKRDGCFKLYPAYDLSKHKK